MTGGIGTTRAGVGVLVGIVLMAGGCRQLNASHCGNQQGDLTCAQRDLNAPFCNRCEAVNDGCVATRVIEAGCGSEVSSGGETTASTAASEASSAETTESSSSEGVDSSSTGAPNLCGNGVIDDEEACDGEIVPEETPGCAVMGYGEGMPACQDDCTITYMTCPAYMEECGNGEVGEAEECDGTNFANQTCDDFTNKTGEGLMCTGDCLFNTTNCMACVETDEPCVAMGMPCCNAPEETCVGGLLTQKRCCVGNGLGGCA